MSQEKNKKYFHSSTKGFVFLFSRGRTGNILSETAVLSKIYPNRRIIVFTKLNNFFKFKANITSIEVKNIYFTRISVIVLRKVLFYLAKFRLISYVFEYGANELVTDIKHKKGLVDNIALADYNSYFQIPKFLNKVSIPFDLKYYQNKLSLGSKYKKLNWEKCCFIHVRRGDYNYWPSFKYSAVLNSNWYLNAIKLMVKEKKVEKFILCTDDVEYCKDTLLKEPNIFLFHSNVFEDLLVMSKCRHGILSASTLSWWAAFISRKECIFNSDSLYLAPKFWFGHRKKTWVFYIFNFDWITYL
tara:strand:- start:435 stop:1334 length:900 start_codon:yes stop_codon:yes gene_type:complete